MIFKGFLNFWKRDFQFSVALLKLIILMLFYTVCPCVSFPHSTDLCKLPQYPWCIDNRTFVFYCHSKVLQNRAMFFFPCRQLASSIMATNEARTLSIDMQRVPSEGEKVWVLFGLLNSQKMTSTNFYPYLPCVPTTISQKESGLYNIVGLLVQTLALTSLKVHGK